MTGYVIVSTTTDDRSLAGTIARSAIERRLAACARIHSAESVYRWDGRIETAEEFVVELKTTVEAQARVEALILELHSYDLPEVVVTPILGGSKAYLDWISDEAS